MIARAALFGLLLLSLAGCGLKPAAYPVPESEMPDSPGLLSGPTGQVLLLKR